MGKRATLGAAKVDSPFLWLSGPLRHSLAVKLILGACACAASILSKITNPVAISLWLTSLPLGWGMGGKVRVEGCRDPGGERKGGDFGF